MMPRSTSLRLRPLALGLCSSAIALSAARRSSAQAEAQKPAPNVMLLVDTSGSMEWKTDGTFPSCVPGDTTVQQKSRWIDLVEVLTGSFNNYSCWAEDRSSTAFLNEFSLSGVQPYDYGYVNPYNRALSNGCAYGAGVVPSASSPYGWPTNAVSTFAFVSTAAGLNRPVPAAMPAWPGCPAFSQASDGLLDVYKNDIRFGLMTFDARVSAGTGLSSGSSNYVSGMDGNWSYYVGSPVTGHPANCSIDTDQEIGARNAAAPPWEGRMIAFGAPNLSDYTTRNGWIQQVLLSTRPYGATPIAGQLQDAKQFLWDDVSTDPLDSTQQFGPTNDPNWRAANCRKTIMILLTDGEPNLDLRPYCDQVAVPPATGGRCPYSKPEDTVLALRTSPPTPSLAVDTYVVGFALSHVTPYGGSQISCTDLTDTQCADSHNASARDIQACCTLNKIAAAGSVDSTGTPRKAYFADNRTQLKSIFTTILDSVTRAATRTNPVFSNPGGDAASRGFKFFSAFDSRPDPDAPQLWAGILERHRFVCGTDLVAKEDTFSTAKGDDFANNLNTHGDQRWFYTVIGTGDNRYSIRPSVTANNDGLGLSGGTQVFANQPSSLAGVIPPAAMNVTPTTCATTANTSSCRDRIVQHLVGITNADGYTRCPAAGCRLFGGIYHSTPTVVSGRPSEQLRDESYGSFGQAMATDARPSVLYTSTVDGFLHAFNLAPFPGSTNAATNQVNTNSNNELWSFIPPAVLPVLQAQYPSTPAILLDGVPIIKDVVSKADASAFERVQSEAQGGSGTWRSVLVQGFGESQVGGGYFAVDITTPDRLGTHKPKFLWQLTRNASGTALFGTSGTPLITTVFLQAATGGPREVPVAVLPGGDAAAVTGTAASTGTVMPTDPPTPYQSTRLGRLYTGAEMARSLTIVRLDTGEVIRTFRPSASSALFNSSVFTATDIPAPITGQPKAFPETTGAVADRIFVGDRDGRLWRLDVSSQDPSQWTMKVFFDAFYDGTTASSQPVVLPPVLSVTNEGLTTVAFATGDQQATAAPITMINRVASLTEELDSSNAFVAKVNWIHELTGGERVTGPMVLFNSGLYYSASRPPNSSTAVCDVGASKVYGTHYIKAATGTTNPPRPANAPDQSALILSTRTDGLIFGLSLQAEPSCVSTETAISGNDSFGYGTVSMSRTVKPGSYYLTFEVSGSNSDARGVLEVKTPLNRPKVPVTFESWALIYE
jgi:type IV pilus assembly protein PilY1